jgi:hypothetical protein
MHASSGREEGGGHVAGWLAGLTAASNNYWKPCGPIRVRLMGDLGSPASQPAPRAPILRAPTRVPRVMSPRDSAPDPTRPCEQHHAACAPGPARPATIQRLHTPPGPACCTTQLAPSTLLRVPHASSLCTSYFFNFFNSGLYNLDCIFV